MARGREWNAQVVQLVVMKHVRQRKTPVQIADELSPNGPKLRAVQLILHRWNARIQLTGRERAPRSDLALQGEDLRMFERVVLRNPVSFLGELAEGMQHLVFDGRRLSKTTVCRTLARLGLTRQRLYTISVNYVEWKRIMFWRRYQNMCTIDMLLFTDESGVAKSDVLRRYQWARRGRRPENRALYVCGRRYTMIPVMSIYGVVSYKILRAKRLQNDPRGTDTTQFKSFVRECIVPHLRPYPQPHSVVVMDRASIHFRPDVIELIERRGARVLPTAPYCPFDQPTEFLHAWVKQWIKIHMEWAESVGAMVAIDTAYQHLPFGYARRVIEHCGY